MTKDHLRAVGFHYLFNDNELTIYSYWLWAFCGKGKHIFCLERLTWRF